MILGDKDFEGPTMVQQQDFYEVIRKSFGAPPEPEYPKLKWGSSSPLKSELIQKWLGRGRNQEKALKAWVQAGVPLGTVREILTHGIFLPTDNKTGPLSTQALREALAEGLQSYKPVQEAPIASAEEADRVLNEWFAERIEKVEALERLETAAVWLNYVDTHCKIHHLTPW